MIRNYFKLAVRHLRKNKLFSLINIVGLALGIASSLLIFLHVFTELSYDDHFIDADNIYRLAVKSSMAENEFEAAVTGGPLAQILHDELPEVITYTRLREGSMTLLSVNDKKFYEENILYADSSFFDLFSFEMISGIPEKSLIHPKSVIITQSISNKYFGEDDPVGKTIKWNNSDNYTVTGVIRDLDKKTHLRFDILVSFSTLLQNERYRNFIQSLYAYSTLNYIKLHRDVEVENVERKIANVVDKHMGEGLDEFGGTYEVFLQPITSIYLHSDLLHELKTNSDVSRIYIFSAVALLILIIACINFVNLSTARSLKRSMEVGVRKVFGANKAMLIRQLISESFIIVLISFLLAMVFFDLALPVFNTLSGNDFTMGLFLDWEILRWILICVCMLGLIAGFYPALYLAKYKPIDVIKGGFTSGIKKSRFRNIMVTIQFVISVFLIAGTFLIYKQLEFVQNKDVGLDKENLLIISLRNSKMTQNYSGLKAEMEYIPGVIGVSGASAYLGNFQQRRGLFPEGGDIDDMILMLYLQVDHNYLDLMDANIIKGRNFFENSLVDSNTIVINKAYLDYLNWDNPIGKNIYIPTEQENVNYPLKIVGVVDDFNFASLHEEVKPLVIMNDPQRVRKLIIRIDPNDMNQVISLIESKWEELYPEFPFEFVMQKTIYEELYNSEINMAKLFLYLTLLAIFIAALGLFGLSSFSTEQRTREIGIRKVFGSSVNEILIMLSKEFARLVIIAVIIAIPISWFGMDKWLQNFAYQTNISLWIFIVSGLIALVIAYVAIIFQAVKASRINPVDTLKYE